MFYQTRLKSVSAGGAIDAAGKRLTFVGNNPAQVGDTVWTDGKIIFGHVTLRSTPLIIVERGGVPVAFADREGNYLFGYFTPNGDFKRVDFKDYNSGVIFNSDRDLVNFPSYYGTGADVNVLRPTSTIDIRVNRLQAVSSAVDSKGIPDGVYTLEVQFYPPHNPYAPYGPPPFKSFGASFVILRKNGQILQRINYEELELRILANISSQSDSQWASANTYYINTLLDDKGSVSFWKFFVHNCNDVGHGDQCDFVAFDLSGNLFLSQRNLNRGDIVQVPIQNDFSIEVSVDWPDAGLAPGAGPGTAPIFDLNGIFDSQHNLICKPPFSYTRLLMVERLRRGYLVGALGSDLYIVSKDGTQEKFDPGLPSKSYLLNFNLQKMRRIPHSNTKKISWEEPEY